MYLDLLLIAGYSLLLLYLLYKREETLLFYFILASFFAYLWVGIFGKEQYGYNHHFVTIDGIQTVPLLLWALGLFGVFLLYSYFKKKLKKPTLLKKVGLFLLIYWPGLIIVEIIGYHVIVVQNIQTALEYPGLPICDCIHAPDWMKLVYFSLGPLFFIVHKVILKLRAARVIVD